LTLPPETEARYRLEVEAKVRAIAVNLQRDKREVTASDANWLRRQLYKELTVYGTFYGPRGKT